MHGESVHGTICTADHTASLRDSASEFSGRWCITPWESHRAWWVDLVWLLAVWVLLWCFSGIRRCWRGVKLPALTSSHVCRAPSSQLNSALQDDERWATENIMTPGFTSATCERVTRSETWMPAEKSQWFMPCSNVTFIRAGNGASEQRSYFSPRGKVFWVHDHWVYLSPEWTSRLLNTSAVRFSELRATLLQS